MDQGGGAQNCTKWLAGNYPQLTTRRNNYHGMRTVQNEKISLNIDHMALIVKAVSCHKSVFSVEGSNIPSLVLLKVVTTYSLYIFFDRRR